MTDAVRPTKSCLTQLRCVIPNLGTRLSDIVHPLIVKAQQVPAQVAGGGGEHIRALTDRRWVKVKTGVWRGAVTDMHADAPESIAQFDSWWWLGAGGTRRADSAQSDFYAQLAEAAHSAGPHSCSTDDLLPADWDVKRLIAEAGVNAQLVIEQLVRRAAAESLLNSDIRGFVVGDRDVRVRISVRDDGQAFVAIGATGSLDPKFFVALVSALPGIPVEDWLPEPEGGLAIVPMPGEVVWSAMFSADAQQTLLNLGSAQ